MIEATRFAAWTAVLSFIAQAAAESPSIYFAICSAMKDENEYANEWIAHHASIGCQKFYLFDHDSRLPLNHTLGSIKTYEASIEVERMDGNDYFIDWRSQNKIRSPQLWAYNRCLSKAKSERVQFLAFIDADEFLVLQDWRDKGMREILKDFELYGGLGVNWRMFGSSGHVAKPAGGVVASYTRCLPQSDESHRFIKTIANVPFTEKVVNPHYCKYSPGKFAVNEGKQRIWDRVSNGISYRRLALHRYATKSLNEFQQKMKKGSGSLNHRSLEFFVTLESAATEFCPSFKDTSGELYLRCLVRNQMVQDT